jgi:hypothetical protein
MMTHVERRSQRAVDRLARETLGHQAELIRQSFLRQGKSQHDADEIVETVLDEFRKGDIGLLEFFREKSLN